MYHIAQLFLATALPTDAACTQVRPGSLIVSVAGPNDLTLPGALVTIVGGGNPVEQVTNAQGYSVFVDLPPAKYALRASLEGFKPNTGSAVVRSDVTADVTIVLQPAIVEGEDCSR